MNCEIPLALHVILWSLTLALVILVAGLGAIAWFMFVDEVHERRVKRSKQNTEQPANALNVVKELQEIVQWSTSPTLNRVVEALIRHHNQEAKS